VTQIIEKTESNATLTNQTNEETPKINETLNSTSNETNLILNDIYETFAEKMKSDNSSKSITERHE
jgi:hypothetical protein